MGKYMKYLLVFLASLFLMAVSFAKSESPDTIKSAPFNSIAKTNSYTNIDNKKVQALLDQGVLLIDIRREEEWQQTGVIEGSKAITFFDKTGRVNSNFVSEFTAIAKPEQPVMLICRTGNRTKAASEAIAQQLGYKNVMNVSTGITGWIAEKRPVVKY